MAKRKQQTKQPKPRKPIKRTTRKFQLRVENPIDSHVAEILDYKRSQRAEVTTIRDGVRLLWALENNDLSVLWELFPKLKDQITPPDNSGGQLDEIKGMLELIASQRSAGNPYVMQSALPMPATAPKAQPVAAAVTVSADTIAAGMLDAFD